MEVVVIVVVWGCGCHFMRSFERRVFNGDMNESSNRKKKRKKKVIILQFKE